jgi:hypothetical protein
MDPLSIAASCMSLLEIITKTSGFVASFVRDVRDARSDLDAVSRELLSLKTVLEMLADDAESYQEGSFPLSLARQVAGIISNCTKVVEEVDQCLRSHQGSKISKKTRWALVGQNDMKKLRSSLEAHKSALDIALDMLQL